MKTLIEFDVTSTEFMADPYPVYNKAHQLNEVLFDRRLNAYFFCHYVDVAHILRSPEFTTAPLAKRAAPVMGDRVLAQMEGDEHHNKRRTVLSGLTSKLFRERYADLICETTEALLRRTLSTGRIDLINDFGKEYSVLVTLKVLSLPIDRHQDIALWHSGIAMFVTSLNLTDEQQEFCLECSRNLIDYLTPFVEERVRQPGEDFISRLCATESNDQRMTTSEAVALVLNILLAATEPADKTLAYLFKHLLDNPDQLQRVRGDRSLLRDAINETLRLTSPVQMIPRQVDKDTYVSGIEIAKDSLVFCMIGAANRDPEIFCNPDEFILDRGIKNDRLQLAKSAHHLAFGTGMHVCVGATFSLMQIELTAGLLLDRLLNLRFAHDFLFHEKGLYTRGPASLCLEFSPIHEEIVTLERPSQVQA